MDDYGHFIFFSAWFCDVRAEDLPRYLDKSEWFLLFFHCRFSAELRKILSLNCLPEMEAFRIYDVNLRAGKKNVLVFTYS